MRSVRTNEEIIQNTTKFFDDHQSGVTDAEFEVFRRSQSFNPDYWFVSGYKMVTIKSGRQKFVAIKSDDKWFSCRDYNRLGSGSRSSVESLIDKLQRELEALNV